MSQIRLGGFTKSVIGVTGNALENETSEFLKSGATVIWTKPIDMNKLKSAIKEAAEAATASTRDFASAKDQNVNAELRTKLALKRAALQLATVHLSTTHC